MGCLQWKISPANAPVAPDCKNEWGDGAVPVAARLATGRIPLTSRSVPAGHCKGEEASLCGRLLKARGCSSDGRALQSHCRGQGFDSPQLHQPKHLKILKTLARLNAKR